MRPALTRWGGYRTFLHAHHVPALVLALVLIGAAAVVFAGVPIPVAASGLTHYTRAVAFFLMPALAAAPIAIALDGDAGTLEQLPARSLLPARAVLSVLIVILSVAALLPAALTRPAPDAVMIMVQNTLAVIGWTFCTSRWLPPRWSWSVPLALAMAGIMSPPTSPFGWLTMVTRLYDPRLLTAAAAWTTIWAAAYLFGITHRPHGPRDSLL